MKPQRAVIFGSFLKKGLAARDIDLLIVSDYFVNYFWQDRFGLLDLPLNYVYDTWLYSPLEFENLLPLNNDLRQKIEKFSLDLEVYYDKR